jgi:hypothetical protein
VPNDQITYDDIAEYEAKRARLKAYYTTRLKSMSAADPEYARLWDERSEALRSLAESYRLPTGTEN